MLPDTATDAQAVDAATAVFDIDGATSAIRYPDPPGYELREEIGKGGMGVVFRARDRGMNRDVAIKILQDRFSPDSHSAARFVEEAQITGQLQHPGIPAVYQVSTLPDGRPFLAMKLIKGETLDVLLKTGVPINRLAVFESICQALGYAHAHDVIHRDLKPANVMVGAFGEVQVMDWGLAKVLTVSRETRSSAVTDPDVTAVPTEIRTDRTPHGSSTLDGSVMGTPAYMPPEQAAGEIEKIDQRSDVFGLGAILCVLLTGKPPYANDNSNEVHWKAVRGQTEDAFVRLDRCGAEPGVVALCKQCLQFRTTDRPTDANAIAQIVGDLRREAEDRARRAELDRAKAEVSAAEQRKRRRVWLGLAAALLIGAFVSSGLALWANQARRKEATAREIAENAQLAEAEAKQDAIEERNEKEQQRKRAEEQSLLAQAVKRYFVRDLLELADPERQLEEQGSIEVDPDLKVRDVLKSAVQKIDGKFADQPIMEAEIRLSLGITLEALGVNALAASQFERIRELYTPRFGPEHPNTLSIINSLANNYAALRRRDEALDLRRKILAIRERVLGPNDPSTLSSMSSLASSYASFERHAEALQLREKTLALRRQILGPDDPKTLSSMNNLANSYAAMNRRDEALELFERTLTLRKQRLGRNHPETLESMNNLATCYAELGRHEDALRLRETTYDGMKRTLGPDHPRTLFVMANIAGNLLLLKRSEKALQWIRETLALIVRAERAGKQPDPRLSPALYSLMAKIAREKRDPEIASEAAEGVESRMPTESRSLYNAACYRSLAARFLKDATAAEFEANKAMAWLKKAVPRSNKTREQLEQDTDLDALRERADFKALLTSLPYLAPPPRAGR